MFIYVFDSAAMFSAMVVLNVLHPAMVLGVRVVDAEMSDSSVIDLPMRRYICLIVLGVGSCYRIVCGFCILAIGLVYGGICISPFMSLRI